MHEMHIIAKNGTLLAAARLAAKARGKSGTLEILNCLRFDAAEGQLLITATDLETAITVQTGAMVKQHGTVAIPARPLLKMLRQFGESETVELRVERSGSARSVTLTCAAARFALACYSADDFPSLMPVGGTTLTLENGVLPGMLRRVAYAMSDDMSLPHLCGIHLQATGERLAVEATDTHRAARTERLEQSDPINCILPACAVKLLHLLKGAPVTLNISADHYYAECGPISVRGRLVEGEFPNVARVVTNTPTDCPRWSVNRATWMAALERAAITDQHDCGALHRITNGMLSLTAQDPGEEAEYSENLSLATYDDSYAVKINAGYLIDALKCAPAETVTLYQTEPMTGISLDIGEPEWWNVIMPMRLPEK